jgi:hypothetical protein
MGLHERSEQASGGRCTALPHPPLDVLRPSQRRLGARPERWDGISVSPQAIQEHFSPHSKCLGGLQHTLLASVARGGEEGNRSAIDADLQRGQAAIVYSTTHVRPNTIGESGYRPAQHILITEAIREEGFPKKNRHPASRLAREHMMPISCGAVDQVEKGAHLALAEYPFTRTTSGPRANKADTPSSCGSLPLTVDDASMPPWFFGSAITHAGPSDESD